MGMLNLNELPLPGAYVIESSRLGDHRGCFARTFCQRELAPFLGGKYIVQSNYSFSQEIGTVRGLHFQTPPAAEMKFVRCVQGKVFDVIVDLRKGSPTFLQWAGVILEAGDLRMVLVPEGFAHGLQTLKEASAVMYLHTEYFSPQYEGGVRYDDPKLGIEWPLPPVEVSEKDQSQLLITDDYKGINV